MRGSDHISQPSVYTYEQIVEAAFQLLRRKGWSQVTTRAIARELGSSTMPIYSHVRSVGELEKELRRRSRDLLKEYQARSYTGEVLLNLAFGYIAFARDEKQLFRFLYLDRPEGIQYEGGLEMKDSFLAEFGEDSEAASALREIQEAGQEVLVRYTWIFTHGLAMLVNAGAVNSTSDEDILGLLMDAGEAFYLWGTNRREDEE